MSPRRIQLAALALFVFQAALLAQKARIAVQYLPQPAFPNDPLELVTEAQPVQTAEQRHQALKLMDTARALLNVRAQPYHLKTAFTVSGGSPGDGSWNLEDISPSRDLYRWTAQGPGYSAVNLYEHKLLYSNVPATAVPLRVAQVRTAIFFLYYNFGPRAPMRTAQGELNGAQVNCVLVNRAAFPRPQTASRGWDESEYCMDAKSGALVTYSPVPGSYVFYDYTNAIPFHKQIIPGKFTLTQDGQTIIQARVESLTDPTEADAGLFESTGLIQVGVGSLMSPPWHIGSYESSKTNPKSIQIVVLHGMVSPQGTLGEVEVVASSNPGLNQAALERASGWQKWRSSADDEPGVTPQSHEVFMKVWFPGN